MAGNVYDFTIETTGDNMERVSRGGWYGYPPASYGSTKSRYEHQMDDLSTCSCRMMLYISI